MTEPSMDNLPATPAIPLTDALRAAYQKLADTIQSEIENTKDATALATLNPWWAQIDDILQKDRMYRFDANTALFQALGKQISDVNSGLKTLEARITAVAAHFKQAGQILAAIQDLVSRLPGV